jgi:pyrimidine-nucleoside phosphorylase/thymidine phosphorylase
MHFTEVIARKRDGQALARDAIDRFVAGATDGSIPDYQLAALLMAIVLRGMDDTETAALTDAMLRSGVRVDLSSLPGTTVGKHSTGGVGDKVSIALAPLAAAAGVIVPKMSGRGLGHTGGTLDKLESIPGYRTDLQVDEFLQVLRRVGASIIGQTAALAPADKKLYALRDVTATVESIPLIAASIMSKKLAEGSSALVLDVKCGRGAFMKTEASARALARTLVAIGTRAGVRTVALLSRMDAPLGRTIGNALEIAESIEVLRGEGPEDLQTLVRTLAVRMVMIGTHVDEAAAKGAVAHALESGAALDRLRAMIAAHGGDAAVVDEPARLPQARHRRTIVAPRDGAVAALDAEQLGQAAVRLGAGRERAGAPIDHAAGIVLAARPGDTIRRGDPVLHLHYNDARGLDEAVRRAETALLIEDAAPAVPPLTIGWVDDAPPRGNAQP